MKSNWFRIIPIVGLVLLLVGCGPAGSPESDGVWTDSAMPIETSAGGQIEIDNSSPEKDNAQMTQSPQSTPSPSMELLIEKAKEDLAQRLSIDMTQISLVEAKAVVWPDASLGCPQPGMKYKQVPEDGALIILQAQGTEYEYHNGGSRGLFLCEKELPIPEKPPQIDLSDLTPRLLDNNTPPPTTPDRGIPPGEDQ